MRGIKMSNYKHIVVAIDIESEYENVILKALEVAPSPQDISLIHIILPSVYVQAYLYGMPGNFVDDGQRVGNAKETLHDIASKFGIPNDKVFVKCGDTADEIKQLANENDADLIVMGTHGRSGLKLLLGSTANAVLHGVQQDVLAVRMHDNR